MRWAGWALILFIFLAACQVPEESANVVARVGGEVLTQQELNSILGSVSRGNDSLDLRTQVIDQWIEDELLYQEALRLDLDAEPHVEEQLREAERSVLIDALVAPLYEPLTASLSEAEILACFEADKERFRTLESFVHVHYAEIEEVDDAYTFRNQMRRAGTDDTGMLFDSLVTAYAVSPSLSLQVASNYWPESRLFTGNPALQSSMEQLSAANSGRILAVDSRYHYLDILDRVPAGNIPELDWVRELVTMHCNISHRKQLYEQQVERLRTEALAREGLVVRY